MGEVNSCLRAAPLPVRYVSSSSVPAESGKPSDAWLGNSYLKGRALSSSLKRPSIEVGVLSEALDNGSMFRPLFQLVLRESVWFEVAGPFTDVVEPDDEVENLGCLDGEYAMH
jgi:hypothetical protein